MKQIFYILFSAVILSACNNSATQAGAAQSVAEDSTGTSYALDTTISIMEWEGSAISHKHNGTIKLSTGELKIKDGAIVAGSFTIDAASIKVSDILSPDTNAMLLGHLKDVDFLDTRKFPMGKFEITSVTTLNSDSAGNTHNISGNLTLRDQVKNITIPAKVNVNGEELTANGTVVINRLDWGINYHSTTAFPDLKAKLKDNAINDEIRVSINLKAKKG